MADIVSSHKPKGEISIDDMKLLVTAVISFNSDQITSAFLNVEQLKQSLLQQIQLTRVSSKFDAPVFNTEILTGYLLGMSRIVVQCICCINGPTAQLRM